MLQLMVVYFGPYYLFKIKVGKVITLVKDTSLAFTISVLEMFAVAKALASSQTSLIPFVAAGLFYYIFNLLVAVIMETVEKRLNYYQ